MTPWSAHSAITIAGLMMIPPSLVIWLVKGLVSSLRHVLCTHFCDEKVFLEMFNSFLVLFMLI
jgi:hypothetical protein